MKETINSIHIESDSSFFTVSRSGATVTFEGSDGILLKISATADTQIITFNDNVSLELVIKNNQVMMGNQVIDATPTIISDLALFNTYYIDSDGDGYGDPDYPLEAASQPPNYVTDNSDCDDTDAGVHPGAEEIAGDGIDQNCDGDDDDLEILTNFILEAGGDYSEYAYSVKQTSDGGYIMAGGTESFGAGKYDFFLLKFNSMGVLEWDKVVGGAGNTDNGEGGYSVQQTTDGGYIAVGHSDSFNGVYTDVLLLKFDNTGNMEWTKNAGLNCSHSAGHFVEQTTDGGYIVTGQTGCNTPRTSMLTLKFDNSGNLQFSKVAGGNGNDKARSVHQTSDRGYIVAGYTSIYGSGDTNTTALILKYDSALNIEWAKITGGNGADRYRSIYLTTDGGYIAAGDSSSFGAGDKDIFIVKYTDTGNVEWAKTIGGIYGERAFSIVQDGQGNYLVAGTTASYGSGMYDALISKLDSSGNVLWTKIAGNSNYDQFFSINQTADSGYIMAGSSNGSSASHWGENGTSDIFLVKTDSNGEIAECNDLYSITSEISTPTVNAVAVELTENSNYSIPVISVSPTIDKIQIL